MCMYICLCIQFLILIQICRSICYFIQYNKLITNDRYFSNLYIATSKKINVNVRKKKKIKKNRSKYHFNIL